jgi:uncharacterized protein
VQNVTAASSSIGAVSATSGGGYVFNRSKETFIATSLLVADTYWSRVKGLIGKPSSSFGDGSALWIVPCRGVHTHFMRFAIDAIYLDAHNVVLYVEENIRPWRMGRMVPSASTVLEVPAHTAFASGTQPGDHLEITRVTPKEESTR